MINRAPFLEERDIAALMYFGHSVAKIMARRIHEGCHGFYSKAVDWCRSLTRTRLTVS